MKPEEKARVKIDRMFEDAGWDVVDREHYAPDIHAAAIKEGLLKGNLEADYFLFLNGQAIGVLETFRIAIEYSPLLFRLFINQMVRSSFSRIIVTRIRNIRN